MTISVNPATRIITVPLADLTLVSGSNYTYDADVFRLELKDWEDSTEGIELPATHRHNTTTTLSGVTYARTLEIINGFTVTFEDGNYSVSITGANHNIGDVKNVNQVSLIIGNSAGLITVNTGSLGAGDIDAIAAAVWANVSRTLTTQTGLTGAQAAQLLKIWRELGADPASPKTITENTFGESYDEQVAGDVKTVRKVGSVTTITQT